MSTFKKLLNKGLIIFTLLALGAGNAIAADIDTSDIKNSAVTTAKLKNGAVSQEKLKNEAVATSKLKNGAVTTQKLKNGAVTLNKAAPQLKNAIGTFCLEGESVVGMDDSGNFVCESSGSAMMTGRVGASGDKFSDHLVLGDWDSENLLGIDGAYRITIAGLVPACESEESAVRPNPVATIWDGGIETGATIYIHAQVLDCETGIYYFEVRTFKDQAPADASFTFLLVDPKGGTAF